MIKKTRHLIVLSLLFCSFTTSAFTQTKPKPGLKPPVLFSYWGNIKGGNMPLEKVLELVDSSVWVISDKKERMAISRFFLLYKSLDNFEDEKTGKLTQRFNTNGVNIRNDHSLPENWRKMLYENIKRGDEILITEIYVRDKKGDFFLAPDIIIAIK
jgi:hypothetical protein